MEEENRCRELDVEFKYQPGTIDSEFFPRLEAWINEVSAPYRNKQITQETLKQSEEDLAECRNTYRLLEVERRNLKEMWNAPYNEWEIKYKAAISGLTEAIDNMDVQVKGFKNAERAARVAEITKLITLDAKAIAPNVLDYLPTESVWNRIYRDEYANKTYSRNKATLEWRQALNRISTDLQSIGSDGQLLNAYLDLGDLAAATMKVKEDKARAMKVAAPAPEEPAPVKEEKPSGNVISMEIPDELKLNDDQKKTAAATRRYIGPKYKLYILFEFAEKLGLTYEKPAAR